jgi:hypothetical protein
MKVIIVFVPLNSSLVWKTGMCHAFVVVSLSAVAGCMITEGVLMSVVTVGVTVSSLGETIGVSASRVRALVEAGLAICLVVCPTLVSLLVAVGRRARLESALGHLVTEAFNGKWIMRRVAISTDLEGSKIE